MRKALIRMTSVFVMLALLAVVFATFMARVPASASSVSKNPYNMYVLEHPRGTPRGAQVTSTSTFTFTCPNASAGNLVINVTERVTNDADSGQAGNYWALDAYTRTIKVWNEGPDSYCAVVNYSNATFAAFTGQKSPGSTANTGGILTGDEVGRISGGYEALITGQLYVSNVANWPLRGNVLPNPVNYNCDSSANCPGYVDWTAQYFNTSDVSFTFSQPSWGWIYVGHDKPSAPDHGKNDGVWVNALSGNSGDILDVD